MAMTPMHVTCPACRGFGHGESTDATLWPTCKACGGVGYVFAPGAPAYGCVLVLGDRALGEIVTLGNGDHGRVLRHSRSGTPTTWLGPIGLFDQIESHEPVMYPASAGVAEVTLKREHGDRRSHANARTVDPDDPLQRHMQFKLGV